MADIGCGAARFHGLKCEIHYKWVLMGTLQPFKASIDRLIAQQSVWQLVPVNSLGMNSICVCKAV